MSDRATDHPAVWYWDPMHGRAGEVGLPLNLFSETWTALEFKPETGVGKLHISNVVRSKAGAFPEGLQPECFYYNATLKQKREPRPDFDKVKGGALYVSHKMIDLLQGFELGDSTILELPLFDGKESGEGRYPDLIVGPDYDKPFPDRGGLFHLTARKMSFLPERTENISGPASRPGGETYSRIDHEVPLVLVVDAEIACSGADIWIETQFFPERIFCSDRLMQAMKAEGIDSPMVGYSERATLI